MRIFLLLLKYPCYIACNSGATTAARVPRLYSWVIIIIIKKVSTKRGTERRTINVLLETFFGYMVLVFSVE